MRAGSWSNRRRSNTRWFVAQHVEEAFKNRDRAHRSVAANRVLTKHEEASDHKRHAADQAEVLECRASMIASHPSAAPTCDARFRTSTPSTSIIAAGTIVSATTSWIFGAAVAALVRTSSRWAMRISRA